MAPRARGAVAHIGFTLDSGSEDDMTLDELNAMPTPDSNNENKAPRKGRPAATTNKTAATTKAVAKGKTATRQVSGTKAKAATTGSRKALTERTNANASDTEEVEDFEEEEPIEQPKPAKRGRPAKKTQLEEPQEAPMPAKRGRKPAAIKEAEAKKAAPAKATAKSKSKKAAEVQEEPASIPETQPEPEEDPMDIEESIEIEEIPETMPPPPRPTARRANVPARGARQNSVGVRRTGSVSDSERDPALRRKVGDLNRKLEAMTLKYDTLKEAASATKESNFETLRKKTEQVAKDQDAVIKALKQQLAEAHSRTGELIAMKKEIAHLMKENTRLTTENKKLTDSNTASQNEMKILSNKLAAARSAASESKTGPGSAIKPRQTGVVLPGTAEAAKEAQLAKKKVDLYSDLTNLVIVGVKQNESDEDVFDCLQTGLNGTLHFHLTIGSGESYDDAEFDYVPLMHEQRDKELLELLPDYLTEPEGITFPRGQVSKFYSRILSDMSKKVVLEDDEE